MARTIVLESNPFSDDQRLTRRYVFHCVPVEVPPDVSEMELLAVLRDMIHGGNVAWRASVTHEVN